MSGQRKVTVVTCTENSNAFGGEYFHSVHGDFYDACDIITKSIVQDNMTPTFESVQNDFGLQRTMIHSCDELTYHIREKYL